MKMAWYCKVDRRMEELPVTDLQVQGAVTGQWKKKDADEIVHPCKEERICIPLSLHSENQFSVGYSSKCEKKNFRNLGR